MHQAAQVMNNPADIINAAIETLLNEHCELPAFSTLDRMTRRIRTLVNGGIYQRILARLSALLQTSAEASFTPSPGSRNPPRERDADPPERVALPFDVAAITGKYAQVA